MPGLAHVLYRRYAVIYRRNGRAASQDVMPRAVMRHAVMSRASLSRASLPGASLSGAGP